MLKEGTKGIIRPKLQQERSMLKIHYGNWHVSVGLYKKLDVAKNIKINEKLLDFIIWLIKYSIRNNECKVF